MVGRILTALFIVLWVSGCFPFREISQGAKMRSYRGIEIYSEPEMTEVEWLAFFEEIDLAKKELILCVEGPISGVVKKTRLVLVNELLYEGEKLLAGVNDRRFIYLTKYRRHIRTLEHEWLHTYLYLYKGYLSGDGKHSDELWNKCNL